MFKFTHSTSLYESISPNSAFRAGMHVLKKELVQDNIYYDLGLLPLWNYQSLQDRPQRIICAPLKGWLFGTMHTLVKPDVLIAERRKSWTSQLLLENCRPSPWKQNNDGVNNWITPFWWVSCFRHVNRTRLVALPTQTMHQWQIPQNYHTFALFKGKFNDPCKNIIQSHRCQIRSFHVSREHG